MSFLIVVLAIAGIGGLIYTQTGSALQERTEQDMERSTTLQANTVGEWVERNRDTTRHLARSTTVADGDTDRVASFLADEHDTTPDSTAAIHYYDTSEHEVLASSVDGATGTNYRDADVVWANDEFAVEDGESTLLTDPYRDPVADADAVAFVGQVPDRPDRAVVVVVDLAAQSTALERPSTESDSFTHIVDRRGTVVMSHHTDDINTQNMGSEDEPGVNSMGVERGLDGETGYVEMEVSHGHSDVMTMGFAPVPGTDWVIMTHVPKESAYALQNDIERSVIGLVLFSILGLGLIGAVVGRNTTRSIGRLARQAEKIEDGDLDAELETDRVDEIGQLYDAFDSMRVSLRERIEEVEAARNRANQLNNHLERKADEYSQVMRECAEGDLTERMDAESESEAMTAIADEFNEMIAELEETVDQLSGFATDVATSSEEVTASTEEVRSASVEVAESIQEIADGAEYQNDRLQSVTSEMNDLSTTVEEIATASNEVADLAERTARTSEEGREAAQAAIEGMNEIEAESDRAVAEIETLQEEMERIDELVEFISDVAEQTNMLALNANIEASRSESVGDEGFGVVANEVKDLAADTREAAEDIEELIRTIQEQTEQTAAEVRTTSQQVATHRDAVANATDALEEIDTYAQETNEGVQDISAATEQQASSTQQVVAMVNEAADIAEETAAEAENAAAAGEEQTTSLTEVTENIDTLSQRSVHLSSQLDQFETSTGLDTPELTSSADADESADGEYEQRRVETTVGGGTESRDADAQDRTTGADSGASSDDTDPAFTFDVAEDSSVETENDQHSSETATED